MSTFKAILATTISFQNIDGISRTVPAGTSVLIAHVKTPLQSTAINGASRVEQPGSFIAALGDDSFDISHAEFTALC